MSSLSTARPLISIGVSAYNRKDYLKLCLESLLAQSYSPCEIIVVDDGSTDGTAEMMQEMFPPEKYPALTYVRQENGGDASAKNHAARLARGKYIVFNDSDDLFVPDAVERLFQAIPAGDENACSYGSYQTIDKDGNELPTKLKAGIYPSGMITGELLKHILVNSCGTLLPLQKFLACGGFDESLRNCHDYSLFMEMSLTCDFYALNDRPVFLRRRHGNNISSASYAKMKVLLGVFENFLSRHPELFEKFGNVICKRRGDLHHKLFREARKEGLKKEAHEHACEAYRNVSSLKNLYWRIFS